MVELREIQDGAYIAAKLIVNSTVYLIVSPIWLIIHVCFLPVNMRCWYPLTYFDLFVWLYI